MEVPWCMKMADIKESNELADEIGRRTRQNSSKLTGDAEEIPDASRKLQIHAIAWRNMKKSIADLISAVDAHNFVDNAIALMQSNMMLPPIWIKAKEYLFSAS